MKAFTFRSLSIGAAALSLCSFATLLGIPSANAATLAVRPPPVVLKGLIPSPFSTGAQAPGTFTGDAAEWAVGIVAGKSEALVYLCDGKNPGQWFGASIRSGSLSGVAPNGSVVKAVLKSGAWSGTVSLKGTPVAFVANAATAKNGWGVWRADPSPVDASGFVLGWIATSKGVRGVSQSKTGATATGVVAVVDPKVEIAVDGVPVAASASVPTSSIAGQVRSITLASTIPPETEKLCILKTLQLELATRYAIKAGIASGTNSQDYKDAVADQKAAGSALQACLAGI